MLFVIPPVAFADLSNDCMLCPKKPLLREVVNTWILYLTQNALVEKEPVIRALMLPLILVWTKCWTESQVAGDLRCHDAHVISL